MRKRFAAVIAVIVLTGAGVVLADDATAHQTQGSATPANDGWHPWPSDKCSWSPNSIPGILNFSHACVHHDGCYKGFPNTAGRATYWVSRSQCDAWFLFDMQNSCKQQHGVNISRWAGRQCMQMASNYHYAVRTLSIAKNAYVGPVRN